MFEKIIRRKKETYSLDDYPVTYIPIGKGFTAIENTVKKMIQVIQDSSKNLHVRSVASDIIKDVPEKDKWGEVDAIYNWVRNHTHYVKDIDGEEMLQSPLVGLDMIEKGFNFQGDCDCLSSLLLSLLKSVGYPVSIRIAGYTNDGKYTHVYCLVCMYGEWIPADPIIKDCTLGWEGPNPLRTKDYQID